MKKLMLFDLEADPYEIKDISGKNVKKSDKMYKQVREIYRGVKKKSKSPKRIKLMTISKIGSVL